MNDVNLVTIRENTEALIDHG